MARSGPLNVCPADLSWLTAGAAERSSSYSRSDLILLFDGGIQASYCVAGTTPFVAPAETNLSVVMTIMINADDLDERRKDSCAFPAD